MTAGKIGRSDCHRMPRLFLNVSVYLNGTFHGPIYACRSQIVNLAAPEKPLKC